MCGFILNLASLFLALLQFAYAATHSHAFAGLANCLGCPIGCGGLAWLITGLVFRWRHTGKVCSGDLAVEQGDALGSEPYMWKSGKFIYIYYLTILCLIGVMCLCGCVIACVAKR